MVVGACDQRAAEADLVGAQQQRVKLEQHSAVLAQRNQTLESEARKRKSPREDRNSLRPVLSLRLSGGAGKGELERLAKADTLVELERSRVEINVRTHATSPPSVADALGALMLCNPPHPAKPRWFCRPSLAGSAGCCVPRI